MSATCYLFHFRTNFLKLDIYYQELAYHELEQNPAFGFLSLLSEIGGFLGLLLGASVLTLCELLDHMALFTMNKCRKGNVADNEHQNRFTKS